MVERPPPTLGCHPRLAHTPPHYTHPLTHPHHRSICAIAAQDVSSQIQAVMRRRPFTIVSDNEHVIYLSKGLLRDLQALEPPGGAGNNTTG